MPIIRLSRSHRGSHRALLRTLAGVALLVALPHPAMGQRANSVPSGSQDDSTAIRIMHLNRSGQFAEAERAGTTLLGARTSIGGSGGACAVLIGVTLAQVRQDRREAATASMQRFDRECGQAVFSDFFPAESDRVRRLVRGESAASVYGGGSTRHAVTDGGATDVMMLNREGRWAEAEQIGTRFLADAARAASKPEACAVLIGVTHAQHLQRKPEHASSSLQRFDRECAAVRYQDWFPGEADRVRRMIRGQTR